MTMPTTTTTTTMTTAAATIESSSQELSCIKTTTEVVSDAAASIVDDDVDDYPEEEDDDQMLREKQQQLLLANMFANLQQKLIHSVFCPQCNYPFANEDQLRAHIEIEHMNKFQFFSEAAAAAAAAAATAGAESGGNSNNQTDHLKQIAEHLTIQQKLHEQLNRQQRVRKRKREHENDRSPSSRSISSESSNDSSNSTSYEHRMKSTSDDVNELNEHDLSGGSPSIGKSRKRSSKDLNHNLLQSLNHLPPNLISPLISSLNGGSPKPTSTQQPQRSLMSSSPSSDAISSSEQQQQQQQNRQSSDSLQSNPAAALASMFPSSMASFLFPMLSQSGGSVPSSASHKFASMRDHPQQQQHNNLFGPGVMGPNVSQSSAMLNGVSVGSNPSAAAVAAAASLRIFNPEAYCELCNKEFCNKYFLKTHKANKHGIYTPETGNERNSGPDMRSMSSIGNSNNSPLMPPTSSGLNSIMSQSIVNNNNNNNGNGLNTSSKASPNGSEHNPFVSSAQGSPNPGSMVSGFAGVPMRLNLNMNMINLDSYCEICQKEFCNKYFLKKHKQKIHGFVYQGDTAIPPPNLAAQLAQSQQQQQQQSNMSQLQQLQQLHLLQQQLVVQQQQHQQRSEREIGINRQTPPSDLDTKNSTSPSPSVHNVNGLPLTVITNSNNTGTGNISTDKSSMNSNEVSMIFQEGKSLTPEKLRSMGVINADAFCEICCKEFCNKYFLRTHKINKHGILDGQSIQGKFSANNLLVNTSPSNRDRECDQSSPSLPSNLSSNRDYVPQFVSPSGSVSSSSLPQSNNSDDNSLEPGQRDPTSYGKNSGDFLDGFAIINDNSGVKCDLCPVHFPNSYLLKMHKFYTHDIPFNHPKDTSIIKEESSIDESKVKSENDSETETEVSNMPSMMVTTVLNQETSSQHSSISGKDGQDLQKLHSMIRDLIPNVDDDKDGNRNEDESTKVVCHVCKYECESRYYLRAHLINEHGFPPTEEAFLQMMNPTSGMSLFDQSMKSDTINANQPLLSSEAYCEICNKEFCSKYFLKTHKQKIHNINMDNNNQSNGQNGVEPSQSSSSSSSVLPPNLLNSLYQAANFPKTNKPLNSKFPTGNGNANNIHATIQAAIAAGLVPPPLPSDQTGTNVMTSVTPTTTPMKTMPNIPNRSPMITGRNYCNICNKELCNKYFMKTHMLKMHNINIDEHPIEAQQSSTIGGVTCDICQKELCSKYFLKVHKQNTHGIYEDGSAPPVLLGPNGGGPYGGGRGNDSQRQSVQAVRKMMPHLNGPMSHADSLGAFNPMLFMSMMQSAAAAASPDSSDSNSVTSNSSEKELKMNGIDPSNDSTNRLLNVFQEACQLCDRRFKSIKWLKAHMMNEHGDLIQLMRTSGEITQAIAQSTGANADNLGRLCFVCGQMFGDRLAMHIHLIKEHKVTGEELALNLAGNIKMAAIMAAAAAAAQQSNADGQTNVPEQSVRMPTPAEMFMNRDDNRRTSSHSRSSTPSSPKSDEHDGKRSTSFFNGNHLSNNPTAALQNLLMKQSGLSPMALFGASHGNHQWASNLLAEQTKMDYTEEHYGTPTTGHGNTKNPPGKFVCQICFRTYRHAHSLQRHMISHRPKQTSTRTTPPPPPTSQSTPTTGAILNSTGSVTPSIELKGDQNGNSTNEKPRNKRYRCSKCNKKFRTRELCLVHIRALHSVSNGSTKPNNDSTSGEQSNKTDTSSSNNLNVKTEIDMECDDGPISMNIQTSSMEEPPEQHLLPPSPSASSEDDQQNGHNQQQQQQQPKSIKSISKSATSYMPQSPVDDEEVELNGPKDLSLVNDSLHSSDKMNLNLNLNSNSEEENFETVSKSDQLISRPSLICINSEKY